MILAPAAWAGATEPLALESGGRIHVFDVELADTEEARRRGLMDRDSLAADAGMLFVWPRAMEIRMWMKNTFIPLDMLFLDRRGRVVHIVERAEPGDLTPVGPDDPVTGVLEVAGGTAERLGVAVGDRVVHPAFAGAASK